MKDFPLEMQGDIALHLNKEALSLPMFRGAGKGCLKSIAIQIKPTFCPPGEYIVHRGDVIRCLYFVCNGYMEVLKDNTVVAILGNVDLMLVNDIVNVGKISNV